MKTYFVIVEKSDVTQAMLNCSTSSCVDSAPSFLQEGLVIPTQYTILEVEEKWLMCKNYLDTYKWYRTKEELQAYLESVQ